MDDEVQAIPMPIEIAREIARQGEVELQSIMTLATAADVRATTLCGIFGAAGVGIGAGVLAYLASDHPAARLVASGTVTGLIFFIAAVIAAWSASPEDFYIAGGLPDDLRTWSWDEKKGDWRNETEMLDATGQRYADYIKTDLAILDAGAARVIRALWVACFAPLIGIAVYFLC